MGRAINSELEIDVGPNGGIVFDCRALAARHHSLLHAEQILSVCLSALFIATTPYSTDGTDGKHQRALGAKPVIKLSEINRRCRESVLLTLAQLVPRLSRGTAVSAAAYVQ